MSTPLVHPIILSGGVGSRLWPMSRALYPKQFLPLMDKKTMLAETVQRIAGDVFADPVVICNDAHRFIVAEQLRGQGIEASRIILEPIGRNTAAATAVGAYSILEHDPEAVMLVMPSDHVIGNHDAFAAAIECALPAATNGHLVTFGITPTAPETGYGYIRGGDTLSDYPGILNVAQFVEKPNFETAETFIKTGEYYWNAGIFLFRAQTFLDELQSLAPEIATAARQAWDTCTKDLDFHRLDKKVFAASPSISIDVAVMEKTRRAAVVCCDIGWSDVGSWSSLWELSPKDKTQNVLHGDVMAIDVHNSYIRSEGGPLTAVVGLDNVVVVATDDAVLVTSKDHAQGVKTIVEALSEQNRQEHLAHSTVYRPWGSYHTVDIGDRFQVKQIVVYPGQTLSLQYHFHRAEHWIVVEGTARVTCGDTVFLLHENESTYIPRGAAHRLENPGRVPLRLIEVQSGSYLGEDDIVRIEDTYGRC